MNISKGTIAIFIASLALVMSCYNIFSKESVVASKHNEPRADSANVIANTIEHSQNNIDLITELNKKISLLQRQVASLKLQSASSSQVKDKDEFKQLVFNLLEEREQQELNKLREQNPLYGFYADLPEDYDLRMKSDPAYAKQITSQLREQALNPNLSDLDRLAALNQLQMNMFILNKSTMSEYDYEVVGNILDLAQTSSDEKFKIQAIELTSQAPIADYRLAEKFTNLLERETNDYIRRLAAQGLMTQILSIP